MSLEKKGDFGFDKIEKELNYLKQNQVAVGFFGEDDSLLLTVVRANEYGAHIVPKNTKYLWVPSSNAIHRYGKTVRARDVKGLFVPKGKHVACVIENGKSVVYFYLMSKSDIPARPFLRKSLDENKKKYGQIIKAGIEDILYKSGTGKKLLSKLGITAVADIRRTLTRWTKPGNAPLTIANKKGQNDPLTDTGDLPKRVTWKIIPAGGKDE